MKIKICGITTSKEVVILNKLLPDYVGLVFAKSKRRITKKHAYKILTSLSNDIKRVGVFVDEKPSKVIEIAKYLKLDIIQLHGKEDNDYITNIKQQLDIVIWKSFNITNQKQVTSILDCKADYLVFDSNIAGSGVTADWSINLDCIADKLILAGGININNISSAIKLFNPRVIDISTGVEVNGIKDEYKINEIINYIRRDYNL